VKDRTRFLVILGDDAGAREAVAREHLAGREFQEEVAAANWPFEREVVPRRTAAPVIWIRDLHLAFPAGQTAGTRLVLTQSTYQLQRWFDWLDAAPGVTVVADADRSSLMQSSPEAVTGRAPWGRIEIVDVAEDAARGQGSGDGGPLDGRNVNRGLTAGAALDEADAARSPAAHRALRAAFLQRDPEDRLEACRRAINDAPANPALLLAFSSTCMELQLLDDAAAMMEGAVTLAPDWEAVHFERGKLLLRLEETEGAAAAFTEAVRLMPAFAAALLNLGAAFGELGRRAEAQQVLQRALQVDPRSHTALNNLGAVYRDEGLLDEAAGAFRGVIELAPAFVFGYYNLGQTLLLKGDVKEACRTYEEGFARDPQKNPRQACRLAVARAAAGNSDGARHLIEMVAEMLPRERAADLFEEAEGTLGALSAHSAVNRDAIDRLRVVIRSYSS
jgi:tetratricopeptide (TPR) repeat protein